MCGHRNALLLHCALRLVLLLLPVSLLHFLGFQQLPVNTCEIGKIAGYRHGILNKQAARLPGILCCTWTTVACSKLHSEVNICSGLARTGWTAAWAAEHWQATPQPIRLAFSSTPNQGHRSPRPTCLDVANFYSLVDVGWRSVKKLAPNAPRRTLQ